MNHGTTYAYSTLACRCEHCKAANREARRKWRGSTVSTGVAVSMAIRERAVRRLIEVHEAEFAALVQDEAGRDLLTSANPV